MLTVPVRGIKSLENRQEEKEKKQFQEDIQYFLAKDVFTIHDFHERVLKGLESKSTFKMMIWGDDTEFKILENQNKICSAMTDEEKNEEKFMSSDDKREIAEVTQMEISDVVDVLAKHKQLKDFHRYLKEKRQRNEAMPESREDLLMMYRVERPAFLTPKVNRHKRVSPKDAIQMRYRKHT